MQLEITEQRRNCFLRDVEGLNELVDRKGDLMAGTFSAFGVLIYFCAGTRNEDSLQQTSDCVPIDAICVYMSAQLPLITVLLFGNNIDRYIEDNCSVNNKVI